MSTYTLLAIRPNRGYAPHQVAEDTTPLTLGEFAEALAEAIAEYGEDSLLITCDTENRYGASFGTVSASYDLFTAADDDGDDDTDPYR